MCGIAGFIDLVHGVSCGELAAMNNVAKYRGPDDEGYALVDLSGGATFAVGDDTPLRVLENAGGFTPHIKNCDGVGNWKIGLAHRRLSIIDVSASGHQPMVDTATGCVVVYNGEIYNYPEVRKELESSGAVFMTDSDTEVLLQSYLMWGLDCLNHLNGMWGFALWDPRTRTLFCARDRLGAKPFHWWREGGTLFGFGSEIKQILRNSKVPKTFNLECLASNVVYGISDYDQQTPFAGIHQLEPGHRLVLSVDESFTQISSFRIEPYWMPKVRLDARRGVDEWVDLVRSEIERACSWRMRSDVPIAMLLSGGLDSSCLTAEVADQLRVASPSARLATFTTSYSGQIDCDETYFAQLVNSAKCCSGHIVEPIFPGNTIEKAFSDLVWHMEGRCGIAHLGAMSVAQVVSDSGYKVLLNGQCGDETMFGYERYYAFYLRDLIRHGNFAEAQKEFSLAARNSKLSARMLAGQFLYFNTPAVRSFVRWSNARSYCRSAFLDNLNRSYLEKLLFPDSLDELLETELRRTQLTHIVRMDDRYSMAASVETRIPFMDYQYVELACSVPPSEKIHGGWTKYLIRKAFEGRLPDEVIWRRSKLGFPAPRSLWLSQISDGFIEGLLNEAATADLFNVKRLRRMSKTSRAMETFLWVELLARQFDVRI